MEVLFRTIVTEVEDYIREPLFTGIILDICRSAPMSREVINEAKLKSWGKEISVCEAQGLPHRFNFRVFFGHPEESILPYVPPNPQMARYIQSVIDRWKERMHNIPVHYPRLSRKQVSWSTVRDWESFTGMYWERESRRGGVEMTQEYLERFLLDTGYAVRGVCEVRQKWYKHGVSPRTYFAQGGTTFHSSKFLQGMWNDLVDSLDCTNHVTRLNPTRIELDDSTGEYLRIYDLSSFTSNHHEQKFFIDDLASYCAGTTVDVMDVREGVVTLDLGCLLSTYNQTCNYSAEYSLEKLGVEFLDFVSRHNNASFLGIYANLSSCTFVHGATVLQAFDTTKKLNVAGDDGHFAEKDGMEDVTTELIRGNGVIEESKEFSTREDGAVCLKRGIIQLEGGTLLQKPMVIWPSLDTIGGLFGYSSPQFSTSMQDNLTKDRRRDILGSELLRFLTHVFHLSDTGGLDLLIFFLQRVYEEANLPEDGSLPQCGDHYILPILPREPSDLCDILPLEKLVRSKYRGVAVVTQVQLDEVTQDEGEGFRNIEGWEWIGPSTKHLSYLRSLDFLSNEKRKEYVWGLEGLDRILREFDSDGRRMYNWKVLEVIPEHLLNSTES